MSAREVSLPVAVVATQLWSLGDEHQSPVRLSPQLKEHIPTFSPFVPHLTLLQNFVLSERPHLGLLPPPSARRRRTVFQVRRGRSLRSPASPAGSRTVAARSRWPLPLPVAPCGWSKYYCHAPHHATHELGASHQGSRRESVAIRFRRDDQYASKQPSFCQDGGKATRRKTILWRRSISRFAIPADTG